MTHASVNKKCDWEGQSILAVERDLGITTKRATAAIRQQYGSNTTAVRQQHSRSDKRRVEKKKRIVIEIDL